jgi:hypothetical protein
MFHNAESRLFLFAAQCLNTEWIMNAVLSHIVWKQNEKCLIPSPQNAFCFTDLSHLVLEILKFFEKHAKKLNTPPE